MDIKNHFDHSPYTKKAFELAYAMLRIAEGIEKKIISSRIENLSYRILGCFAEGDYDRAPELIEEAGWFFRLWVDLGVIHSHLGESLLSELSGLRSISLEARQKLSLSADLKDLIPQARTSPFDPDVTTTSNLANITAIRQERFGRHSLPSESVSFHYDSSNRQLAIIAFFKNKTVSGNNHFVCRMKDVQDNFPGVSERTLRYDLQKLVEQGVVERVGGGPMSAYRLPVSITAGVVTPASADRYNG